MATTIGPLCALKLSWVPEWNQRISNDDKHLVLVSEKLGMAFQCYVVSKNLKNVLKAQESAWVFVAQVLKEDGEAYYAFESFAERELFCELREIDSIGSKFSAIAVGELGVRGLLHLLESTQVTLKVSGLGPKTLEKIRHGMHERKEVFAGLLNRALHSNSGADASEPVKKLAEKTTERSTEKSVSKSTEKNEAFSSMHIQPILLQALNQLGLATQDAFHIFDETLKKLPNLRVLDHGEQLKSLLATWNQHKRNLTQNKTSKSEELGV